MRRLVLVALALSATLLVTGGAEAKAPPDGIQLCGANAACAHLSWEQAENMPELWADMNDRAVPAAPSAFYVVRWHWPNEADQTAYYVPQARKVRHASPAGISSWTKLQGDTDMLRSASVGLAPFQVPTITSVTVGGRPARDPQSYLGLFGRGYEVWPAQAIRWIRVKIVGDAASPWTDSTSQILVSRRGRYLSVDGTILRIPLKLARLIRAARSLQ
jgi:hypothetical protein